MAVTTVKIEGMTCQHCVGKVRQVLEALDGVREVEVEIGSAKVTFDDVSIKRDGIEAAVVKAGYTVVG
jgi:copper chaperone